MSKFFIDRPIVAMVIAILMVLVGGVCFFQLPTAQFPNIVPPEIQVQATYPGADALTLEQAVATPLEQQITGVDNMNYMYSTNANNGQTAITVDFSVASNPDIDQVLTQLRVAQAQSRAMSAWWSDDKAAALLAKLRTPTLVIAGAKDAVLSPRNAQVLQHLLPHASLYEAPDGGHAWMYQEPASLARRIGQFLDARR